MDISQTINRFTELDDFPLTQIDDTANKLSSYHFFSTFDSKSAYYQISIVEKERLFTAFEADGNLYQIRRMPFGLTNVVACFQRIMNKFIEDYSLKDTFAYLVNVTIGGPTKTEHDKNVDAFLNMVHDKTIRCV